MNDKKFIQLLNLYIDGEATPVEVREVELEIEKDPTRRRIYNDYCRIQAATGAMYARFRDGAPAYSSTVAGFAGRSRADGVRSAAAQPARVAGHPFRRAVSWAAGAAAACMAVAVSFWSMPHLGGPQARVEVAESAGVSVPTTSPGATAVAAAGTPSYAAPFAPQMRIDPYLISSNGPADDPFSLRPVTRRSPFGAPGPVSNAAPSFAPASFTPNGDSIDPARIAEENRRLKALLRGEIAPRDPTEFHGL